VSAISTLRLIIQGNSSGLVAAANAGGHSVQGLSNQAHAAGAQMQWMGGNTTVAANGLHLFGAAANAAAHSASGLATHAGQAFRAVGRLSHQAAQGILNKYTALGASVGSGFVLWRGATLDRTLLRIKRTAGATKAQADQIRSDLMKMSVETGTPVEELVGSFSTMIQSGQSWDSAKGAVGAINQAVALTGANADDLAKSLAVAGETFNFDLTQPGKALELLDKMLIAGDLGSAEIEDLSGIFAKVGANAKAANFTMEQTLALTEALSAVEKDKDRLGTLTDSTLRMFTNQKYMLDVAKATGVKFYDKDGSRRDPVKVLGDLTAAYKKLTTEKQRNNFVAKAWGATDQDTIKGVRTLLDGNALTDLQRYVEKIKKAPGEIKNKMGEGMGNAASQLERLKESMKKIGDEAARPVNEVITKYSKLLADHQDLLKNVAIGAGVLLASAVAITTAAKLIGAWQTIRGVFGGGGAGAGGAGGLGGIGGLGSSPVNPMYVVVVAGGGGSPTGPVGPAGPLLAGWGARLAAWAKAAGKFAISPLGAGIIGGTYAVVDEGGVNEYSATRIATQQLGAFLGNRIGGTPGRLIGQVGFDILGQKINEGRRFPQADSATQKEIDQTDRMYRAQEQRAYDQSRRRLLGIEDPEPLSPFSGARPPSIYLTLHNSIDANGQVVARLESDSAGVVALRSESLGPGWSPR